MTTVIKPQSFRRDQDKNDSFIIHPEKNIYAAIGNSGNVIYVNPELNTTVAVTSYFKPTIFDRVDFIEEYILGSLPELETEDQVKG